MQVRWLMDRACLEQAFAHPAGIGLGGFETRYPFWRPREELRLSTHGFTDPATPRPGTPHSEPLLALVELGWGGALLLGAALFLLLRRRERARWTTAPLLALGCHALVRAPLTGNPPALALAALLAAANRGNPEPAAPVSPATRRLFRRFLPLVLALLAAAAAPSQIGGELALSARLASLRKKEVPDPADAARALEARPWDAVAASFHVADLTREHAPPEQIRTALHALLFHDPANLFGLTALYHLEMVAPDGSPREALRALERAESLAPEHPSVRTGRTLWLERMALQEKEAGLARVARGDPAARPHLLRAALLAALVALRNQDPEQARSALWEASAFADSSRALVERTAARADLDETLLRALVLRLKAARASDLGPPVG